MSKEREVGPALAAEFGLKADEYQRILDRLGRTPNMTELGIFSVMWSEHCSYKSSRKHLRFRQHLKAIADAQHIAAAVGMRLDGLHDRLARRHGAAAQIVAIGKPARQHDQIGPGGQFCLLMPDHGRRLAGDPLQSGRGVAVAIGGGKNDDAGFHSLAFARGGNWEM